MPNVQIRFVGEEAREVSILPEGYLRRVEPDEVFTVPESVASSYEGQPMFYEVGEAPARSRRAAQKED